MNRQLTIYLLISVAFLGLFIIVLDSSSRYRDKTGIRPFPRIIEVEPHEIQRIRVIRDYWNTFTLAKNMDGIWSMVEPSNEPVDFSHATRLIDTLATLPRVKTLGSFVDDSERSHEYGLWKPSVQIDIISEDREWRLVFGIETPDGQGVYVTRSDNDEIFITTQEAFQIILTDAELYRNPATPASSYPTDQLPPRDPTRGNESPHSEHSKE